MVDAHVLFHGRGFAGVIVRTAQVVAEQAGRNFGGADALVSEQRGDAERLNLLVFRRVLRNRRGAVMKRGVDGFVDCGADRLYLAHAFPNRDSLFFLIEESVRVRVHWADFNGNGRGTPDSFHKRLVMFDIPGQIVRNLRQRLPFGLPNVEYLDGSVGRNLNFTLRKNGLAVRACHLLMSGRVNPFLPNGSREGGRRENFNAFFALFDVASQLLPCLIASNLTRSRTLRVD